MKIEKLFENEWLTVNKYDGWYTAMQHRYNGVMILPYRQREDGSYEVLLRREVTPCHSPELRYTSITGMLDDPKLDIEATALKELKEEGGYTADYAEYIGPMYPSKASATVIQLFVTDLTGAEQGEITGDGTSGERVGGAEWVTIDFALRTTKVNCPLVGACIAHLLAGRDITL